MFSPFDQINLDITIQWQRLEGISFKLHGYVDARRAMPMMMMIKFKSRFDDRQRKSQTFHFNLSLWLSSACSSLQHSRNTTLLYVNICEIMWVFDF